LKPMLDGRPVTVEVTADGAGLVSHAGTALLGAGSGQGGAHAVVIASAHVPKRRRRGHDMARVIRDLAVMLADGGECAPISVQCVSSRLVRGGVV
jgi:hypothetical protein